MYTRKSVYINIGDTVRRDFLPDQYTEHDHNIIALLFSVAVNMADLTYTNVDNDVANILNTCFVSSFRNGYIKANDVVLPVYFKKFGQRIQDMQVRDDDVWVCSYPKTGKDP